MRTDRDGALTHTVKVASSAFVIALAAFMSAFFLASLVLASLPKVGMNAWCIYGSSMEPYVYAGDLLVTTSKRTPEIGDAIVFENGGGEGHVFHRIVRESVAETGGWVTRGDNNDHDDPLIPYYAFEGVEVVHVPNLGFVVNNDMRFNVVALLCCALLTVIGVIMAMFAEGQIVWVRRSR